MQNKMNLIKRIKAKKANSKNSDKNVGLNEKSDDSSIKSTKLSGKSESSIIKKTNKNENKLVKKDTVEDKDKKYTIIAFYILAIFCIVIFSIAMVPKTFQNDTFYTIKIGQLIRQNGIDYKDHFSWNENLPYMYPHWLYDVITSLIYDFCNGFTGVYVATMILSAILGVTLFLANVKVSKNKYISFIMALAQMCLMRDYIAARAQLVTFILFVLTIIYIEKFLEKPNLKNALVLMIIPILIANIHAAVFPFYFILYLPYIGEYFIRVLIDAHLIYNEKKFWLNHAIKVTNKKLKNTKKENVAIYQNKLLNLNEKLNKNEEKYNKFVVKQNERRQNPYKVKFERNDNVVKLILIMVVCLFTGFLTPIKNMPYMYTYLIMKGNTTKSINEHLPLTLIDNKQMFITMAIVFGILIFTKAKIRMKDLFFLAGLTLLAFMSRRQVSMLVLFGGFAVTRLLADLLEMYDKNGTEELIKYSTTTLGEVITIVIIFCISYVSYNPISKQSYISNSTYPVEACEWIKNNLDYKNMRMFNDYNYGSYMLFQDIPVFIDSRCDLYTPEFNGAYNSNTKKYSGRDIFSDYINITSISTYYEDKFEDYNVDYVITKKNSKLKMLMSRDEKYSKVYADDDFIIYKRNVEKAS